ncbi:hypothetical protein BJX99DRAFT_270171 [Aspergillus californicus]
MATGDKRLKSDQYGVAQDSEMSSEALSSSSIEYKRNPVYSPSEWLLETISLLVGLGLLVGIVVIFSYMDDEPLSKWTPTVSLSATISILTTAFSTVLMHGVSSFISQLKWLYFKNKPRKLSELETFDGASRGVWGSVLLLTTVRWNLATIGAFITILRLTLSPFAQQVILIEQRDIFSEDTGVTFGYTHAYTRTFLGGLAAARVESIPQDPNMQSAVVQGLYGINGSASFSCPGACQWNGAYISLGFKSECTNVTQETLGSAICEGASSRQCNMTTPGGLRIATQYSPTSAATSYYMNASSLLGSDLERPELLPATFPAITRFAVYRSTPDYNFVQNDVNITECTLSLAAYEYTNARANGSDFSFDETRQVESISERNPWAINGTSWQSSRLYTNESTADDIPAVEIGWASLVGLINFFESQTIVTEWVDGSFFNENLGLAAALSGDVDINERFDKMATTMTDYLRSGSPNSQLATGETVNSEAYVSIRWLYFIVPIATEVFAIVFAALTIFSNRKSRRVPLWKSSTLAVLACQHDEQLGLLQSAGKDIDEIGEDAKKADVRLR